MASPTERAALETFERRYGQFGGREIRTVPITVDELRDSGAGEGQFTVVGHAAVFNLWSLDLGYYREQIDPDAFKNVLSRNPDTWLLWDHDTRWTLARTHNKSLELTTDARGLRYWGRVAPTSYAADLRVLMERGDIDQASFAFTVAKDEWLITTDTEGDETIERTILEVGDLYDVTITAMGAYPQTDSQVVRAALAAYAPAAEALGLEVAPADPVDDAAPHADGEGVGNERASVRLVALRARGRRARQQHPAR
jgi:HK97 family phage prohead protease